MSIFTQLPISTGLTNLKKIPSNKIKFFNEDETTAYGHWVFGGDSSCLVDIVNAKPLTPQSQASLPIYHNNFLSISSKYGKSLMSDRLENAVTDSYTMAMVVKIAGTPAQGAAVVLCGSMTYGLATNIGGSPFMFINTDPGNTLSLYGTYSGAITSRDSGFDPTIEQWYFAAVTIEYVNAKQFRMKIAIGNTIYDSGIQAGTYRPNATNPLALGNDAYNRATEADIELNFAELVMINSSLSADDLNALYLRAKARMSRRGITI